MTDGGGTVARAAAVLGHELRNPLASAHAGATLAREMVDDGDPRRAVLDGIVADLARMAALLDSYLLFARVGRPRREPVELGPLAAGVAARRPDRVTAAVPEGVLVAGDAMLLERVLENLVDNALQAGAADVRVGARTAGDAVAVVVEDDGPGVPAELRERIFEPGFSRRNGTGLGLCIAAETVAAHGGAIRCEARPRGARFVIELPVMTQPTGSALA